MRYVAALPKRFVADCRGVTSTLMALSFMGMLGFAGLATEVGLWYVKKRSMQSAADSAAFSAAIALSTGNASTEGSQSRGHTVSSTAAAGRPLPSTIHRPPVQTQARRQSRSPSPSHRPSRSPDSFSVTRSPFKRVPWRWVRAGTAVFLRSILQMLPTTAYRATLR